MICLILHQFNLYVLLICGKKLVTIEETCDKIRKVMETPWNFTYEIQRKHAPIYNNKHAPTYNNL